MKPIPNSPKYQHATFAGGCFWCMVAPFQGLDGVVEVVSGYTGGEKENPKYEEVCSGATGHYEAVDITYDPERISYAQLLDVFWRQIDPTDPEGQFADKGSQYQSGIFYHDQQQRKLAEKSKAHLQSSGLFNRPVATRILPAHTFYPAEEYHQDFHKKNPVHYQSYRRGSGREGHLDQTWGGCRISFIPDPNDSQQLKPDTEELRKRLTPLQYHVTQERGTEPPFKNEYWNNTRPGIYVDIISGKPLFSSLDQFQSGCGWPSFNKPLNPEDIAEKEDRSHGMSRTEVRSKSADSHLGHVFNDGPAPSGLRYCINSAALRFIPVEDLKKEGYEKYLKIFETPDFG